MEIQFVSRHSFESRNPGFPVKTEIHLLNSIMLTFVKYYWIPAFAGMTGLSGLVNQVSISSRPHQPIPLAMPSSLLPEPMQWHQCTVLNL